ncbi:hypothetical protein C2845_PM10G08920 [Panicum miliaceum]|uniref:Uncharacterized protein n=1 Tax=Panicum miliaceum TaxID=4540 RepID=A0A3L6PGH4_PANMI|nr:hypothetical protein C2845_PM10G08920 [Panicum miliaceum]
MQCRKKKMKFAAAATLIGMYHYDTYWGKAEYRVPIETGYQWVMRSLGSTTYCSEF